MTKHLTMKLFEKCRNKELVTVAFFKKRQLSSSACCLNIAQRSLISGHKGRLGKIPEVRAPNLAMVIGPSQIVRKTGEEEYLEVRSTAPNLSYLEGGISSEAKRLARESETWTFATSTTLGKAF